MVLGFCPLLLMLLMPTNEQAPPIPPVLNSLVTVLPALML